MRSVAALAAALALTTLASAQQQAPAPAETPRGPADVGEIAAARVAVDLVVRDRKGRLVRDLKKAEIEVLEDGAAQDVLSLRLVDLASVRRTPLAPGEQAPADSAAPAAAAAEADEHPLFVAFLFDHLSPQGRRTAHDAAAEWLQRPAPRGRRVGVYRIEQGLETLQGFTGDDAATRAAVDLILSWAPAAEHSKDDRERLRALRLSMRAVGPPTDSSGAKGGSPAANSGGGAAESSGLEVGRGLDSLRGNTPPRGEADSTYALLRLETAMLEASEALERDQQGLATVNALLSLVNGLKTAPGRKAIIFFSEGLVLPPRAAAALQTVVAEANRGAVTIYAADAAGLRTASGAQESRRELATLEAELHDPTASSQNRVLTKAMERNEDILRSDPQGGLSRLARGTGGFLVSDTNQIARPLLAAEEDLSAYYLLEYAPSNELWDGRFRSIEVKVRRPGVHVQARQGYFAARTPMPTPLLAYEAPVLAALELAPKARDLDFTATALRVPDLADEYAVPIAVDVPGDAPTLTRDEKQ